MTKKFRVFDKDNNRYLKNLEYFINFEGLIFTDSPISNENHILEQWTGITDNNGIDIFDGDLINTKNGDDAIGNRQVRFCNIEKMFIEEPLKEIYKCFGGRIKQDWIEKYEYIVIGNIHQNRELLK